jgi:hypothetical protein
LNCAANKKRQRRRHTFAAGIIYERAGRRTGKDSITENATCPEIQAGPITFVSLSLGYPCIGSFPLSYQYIEVDDMKTLRKQMMMLLGDNEMSAREISSAVGIGEKEVSFPYRALNKIPWEKTGHHAGSMHGVRICF